MKGHREGVHDPGVPVRAAVVGLASVGGAVPISAIRAVVRRDGDEVRGPSLPWIVLPAVVNPGGNVPLVYRKVGVVG